MQEKEGILDEDGDLVFAWNMEVLSAVTFTKRPQEKYSGRLTVGKRDTRACCHPMHLCSIPP